LQAVSRPHGFACCFGDADVQWNAGASGDEDGTEDSIVFDGATIVTPTGKLLARQLSLVIGPQHSILITGPNGSGAHLHAAGSHVAATPPFAAFDHPRHDINMGPCPLQASPASSGCCTSSGLCQPAGSAAPQPQTELRLPNLASLTYCWVALAIIVSRLRCMQLRTCRVSAKACVRMCLCSTEFSLIMQCQMHGVPHHSVVPRRAQAVFYVPQKPYTTTGTLREQVIYPLTVDQAASHADGQSRVCIAARSLPVTFRLCKARNGC